MNAPDPINTFAMRVARSRHALGLSQRRLSELAGLAPAHVRAVEAGEGGSPRVGVVVALAEALGVSAAWLATGGRAGAARRAA